MNNIFYRQCKSKCIPTYSTKVVPKWKSNYTLEAEAKFLVGNLSKSFRLKDKCFTYGIEESVFKTAMKDYSKKLIANQIQNLPLKNLYQHIKAKSKLDKIITPSFIQFVKDAYPSPKLCELMDLTDLRTPAELYPEARKLKREIIMHVGPTNSGKTHAALERFSLAKKSIYCGPLRLLAHEIYEKMNKKGVDCNLVTGEERKESQDVDRWSCTIEMANLSRAFDVGVIDEIQMITDPSRGWAWTNALLGLQVRELHVCGEPTAIPLIEKLCQKSGDILTIKSYERLTPLTVMNESLQSSLKKLKRGDCVVTFSRKNVFAIKKNIESSTNLRAAVIYGSLPPETRAEQARLFNEANSPYSVLVASDAIGMGLNLNIKRVIFESLEKYDGVSDRILTISETKQISGRAGRFNLHTMGSVTTLDHADLKILHRQMKQQAPDLTMAGLMPSSEHIEQLSSALPGDSLSNLLWKFEDLTSLDGDYFLCDLEKLRMFADCIEGLDIPIKDRYAFVQGPISHQGQDLFKRFVEYYSKGDECRIASMLQLPREIPTNVFDLKELETLHKSIILYKWLAIRFPKTFIDVMEADHLKNKCEEMINTSLSKLEFSRKKKKVSKFRNITRIDEDEEEDEDLKPMIFESRNNNKPK